MLHPACSSCDDSDSRNREIGSKASAPSPCGGGNRHGNLLKAPARSPCDGDNRHGNLLKAPARSTLRDLLRSSLPLVAVVLAASGRDRGGRPLSAPPCGLLPRARRVVVPCEQGVPTPPRARAGTAHHARYTRGFAGRGASALPVGGTSLPARPRAGSAWPTDVRPARPGEGQGRRSGQQATSLADSKGERARAS
jgi:hypothetical protein